jgi:hypothetical protein
MPVSHCRAPAVSERRAHKRLGALIDLLDREAENNEERLRATLFVDQ